MPTTIPAGTAVFAMEGPFFFGAAERLESTLDSIHGHTQALVLRMERVPIIDATGIQSLWDLLDTCKHHHARLVICGARPNILEKLKKAGLVDQIGRDNVIQSLAELPAQTNPN